MTLKQQLKHDEQIHLFEEELATLKQIEKEEEMVLEPYLPKKFNLKDPLIPMDM